MGSKVYGPYGAMAERLAQFNQNAENIAIQEASKGKELIAESNREQLLEGLDNDGKELSPTYLNDPYFKSKESAQRYSDWKDEITPNDKRRSGVPNLFINGAFHKTIKVVPLKTSLQVLSTSKISTDIQNKYGDGVFGLNEARLDEFRQSYLLPRMLTRLNKVLFG